MPADFDPATLRHVAHLARLPLSPEEEARFAAEIGKILGAFESLPRDAPADPHAVEPAPPRADEAAPASAEERARLLAAVPRRDGALVKVPRGLL